MRNDSVAVAVFGKAPIAGQVKSRLIPALGAQGAARLHRSLVLRTLAAVQEARLGPVTLWCAPDTLHRFFRALREQGVECRAQVGDDLGERMRNTLCATLPMPTILVGTDCPPLQSSHLRAAADALLRGNDAVFIPAEDGGYVLIGLSAPALPALFEGVLWGEGCVMAQTRERLTGLGYSWSEPAVLWDLDRPADLDRWRSPQVADRPASCSSR